VKIKAQPNRRLAIELQELLDTDLLTATRVLRAVLQAVKDALLCGKKVYVRGFGTFEIVERTHRPTPNNILLNDAHGRPAAYSPTQLYYKPRRVVIFRPSVPLLAMLNLDTPSSQERRSQRSWAISEPS